LPLQPLHGAQLFRRQRDFLAFAAADLDKLSQLKWKEKPKLSSGAVTSATRQSQYWQRTGRAG
jgi:hypothetical protein